MKVYLIKEKIGYKFNQKGRQIEDWQWFRKTESRMISVYDNFKSAKMVLGYLKRKGHEAKIYEFETDWGIKIE